MEKILENKIAVLTGGGGGIGDQTVGGTGPGGRLIRDPVENDPVASDLSCEFIGDHPLGDGHAVTDEKEYIFRFFSADCEKQE